MGGKKTLITGETREEEDDVVKLIPYTCKASCWGEDDNTVERSSMLFPRNIKGFLGLFRPKTKHGKYWLQN